MIGRFPIVSFDTSAHNHLCKDRSRAEAVFAGLRSKVHFRFAGLSIDEMFATRNPRHRADLRNSYARLQHGMSDCVYPHNEMIRLLVVEHFKNPVAFNWKAVNVRAWEYERGIQDRDLFTDERLCSDQRRALGEAQKNYKETFRNLRTKLSDILRAHGAMAPSSFRQAFSNAEGAEPNLIISIGKDLHDRVTESSIGETAIGNFITTCPPFRSVICALLMTWYDQSLADWVRSERFKAGRNDLFMAAHLPYCDQFVTADREQEKCLREIASLAGLATEILSYENFAAAF